MLDRLARLERTDRAAAVAVGPVDPAVEAELEAVDPVLLVALGEPGEEDLAMVGLAVAVAVLGVEDVGRAGDEHAVAPGHDAGRETAGRRGTSSACRRRPSPFVSSRNRTTPPGFPLPSTPSG